MTLDAGGADVSDEVVFKAVATTGMSAVPWSSHAKVDGADSHRRQQVMFTSTSGVCLLVGFALHIVLEGGLAPALKLLGSYAEASILWPEIGAYVAAALLGARFIVVKAWFSARNLRPDMHLLMTVAVIGAMVIGVVKAAMDREGLRGALPAAAE